MGAHYRRLAGGLVGVLLAAALPTASAQSARGIVVNRPSASAASRQIDWGLGGDYTRVPAALRQDPFNVATLNRVPGVPGRARYAGSDIEPASLRLGVINPTNYRTVVNAGGMTDRQLWYGSGFSIGTRLDTPLYGWSPASYGVLTPRDTPPLSLPTPPVGSRFQQYFGLLPPETPREESEPLAFGDLSAAVERRTQATLRQAQDEALNLFRDATTTASESNAGQRNAKLRQATRLLTNVRHLNDESHLPRILLAHAALERGQPGTALKNLIDAARRNPEAFRDQPNVSEYFGDVDPRTGRSPRLESTMRANLRQSEGATLDSLVLQAYCGWVIGDQRRARAGLESAEARVAEGAPGSPYIMELIHALRYAL